VSDLAVVGIALDTSKVEAGEKIVVRSFANMTAARVKESAAATGAAQAERQATQAVQQTAQALNTAGVSSLEFTRALKNMGGAAASTVAEINRMSAATRAEAQATQLAAAAHAKAASVAASTIPTKTAATAGVKKLENAFTTFAFSLAGIPGPIGRVASTLSSFALGSGFAVAVVAGISAIAFAYEKITGPAKRAREETEKLIASLNKARDARFGLDIQKDMAKASAEVTAAVSALDRARKGTAVSVSSGGGAYTGAGLSSIDPAAIAKAEERVFNALRGVAELRDRTTEFQDQATGGAPRVVTAVDRITAAERRLGEEIEKNLERIRLLTEGSYARGSGPLTPTTQMTQILSPDQQAMVDLRNRVRSSPLLTPEAIGATGKEVETRISAAMDEAARNFQRAMTGAIESLITGGPDFGKRLGQALASGAAGILSAGVTDSISKAFKALPAETQERIKQIGGVVGAGAVGASVGYNTGSTGLGALSGAATGFAVAGPVGAIVGGVAGLVGGLLGSSKQAKEAARQMEEARKAFGLALTAFSDEAFGTATNLSRGIANATALGEDLKAQAPRPVLAGGSRDDVRRFIKEMDEYNKALAKVDMTTALYIVRLMEEEAARSRLIDISLDEREARLAGNDEEAFRARARREQEEVDRQLRNGEITAAQAARTSAVIDGELNKAIEGLGDAAREATARLEESLVTRELRAKARMAGTDAEVEAIEAQIRAEEKRLEIEQAVRDGVSAVTIASLQRIQVLEDEAIALEKVRRIEEANASFATGLVTRELRARARMAGSDAEVRAIEDQIRAEEKRLEIERAIKDGMDETNIASLQRIQVLEDEAIAMERSKKAEEDRLQIIRESTAFLNDLKSREFRATGQGAAADEYNQRRKDEAELEAAAKFGTEYVMETLRVQGLERADRDAQRRASQDAAFAAGSGSVEPTFLADSRTTANFAIGASESSVNRLVGVAQSQLIYHQQIAANTKRIADFLDRGALVTTVDTGLAVANSDANLAAGVPPGNR